MSDPTSQNALQAMQARILQLEEHARQANLWFDSERSRFENELKAYQAREENNNQSLSPVKIPLPDFYEGNPMTLNDWLFQLKNYFELTQVNDRKKVILAITLLRGSTLTWWRNLSEESKPTNFHDFELAITLKQRTTVRVRSISGEG